MNIKLLFPFLLVSLVFASSLKELEHSFQGIDEQNDAFISALRSATQKHKDEVSSEGFIPEFIQKELLSLEELRELELIDEEEANTTKQESVVKVEEPKLPQATQKEPKKEKKKKVKVVQQKKKIKEVKKEFATINYKPKSNKVVYLTFDDGPLIGTSNVLRALKDEDVSGTMFVVGEHIQNHKKLFKKLLKSEHIVVGNHTYSHANGKYQDFYNNTNRCVTDIGKAQKLLREYTKSPRNMRYFPVRLAGRNVYRLPNAKVNDYNIPKYRRPIEAKTYNALASRGYKLFGWDSEWVCNYSTGRPVGSAEKMVAKLEKQYKQNKMQKKGHIIVLLHDYMFRTKYDGYNNLRALIRGLKKKGWTFGLLHEYI